MGGRDVAGKRTTRKSTAASRLGLARILAIGILIVAAPTARTAATRPEERSRSFHLEIISSSSCFADLSCL